MPPEHREVWLRLLGTRPTPWPDLVELALHLPAFLQRLFEAVPLTGQRLGSQLREDVSERLQWLGEDLLKAWLLSSPDLVRNRAERRRGSPRRIAALTHRLALATAYPFPDEAYLVGLWHRLGETSFEGLSPHPASPAIDRHDARSCASAAHLAQSCGLPPPALDALALRHIELEQVVLAHPLCRLLWCAVRLARADWEAHRDGIGRVCGLSADALALLRADPETDAPTAMVGATADLPATATQPPGVTTLPTMPTTSGGFDVALREAALSGLMRNAFSEADEELVRSRLPLAAALLCGTLPALVVVAEEDHLVPLALTRNDAVLGWYADLGQRADDETSAIALAIRTATPTSRTEQTRSPRRSVRDWQIGRWLGREGFVCLPFSTANHAGALVVASSRLPDPPAVQLLTMLVAAAAASTLASRREKATRQAIGIGIEQRYRAHAKRVVHEASSPLTVIKSYLSMIAQRHPEATELNDEMRIVHSELDRIGTLIEKAAAPPAEIPEPEFCHLTELLHDLRAIYGEALFGQRGIHFELRTLTGLPAAALPGSALRQVLLNLLRNAAEILHPGGRCTVALAGQLMINGTNCLEIRVIDNGPGLPPERMHDLFSPRPSTKGGSHQGVGLSIVHEILERWGASILCRSQEGTGTSFQLLVPVKQ